MLMALKVNPGFRNEPAAISFLVDTSGFGHVAVYTGAASDVVARAGLRWSECRR
jgi:hypothetical protein